MALEAGACDHSLTIMAGSEARRWQAGALTASSLPRVISGMWMAQPCLLKVGPRWHSGKSLLMPMLFAPPGLRGLCSGLLGSHLYCLLLRLCLLPNSEPGSGILRQTPQAPASGRGGPILEEVQGVPPSSGAPALEGPRHPQESTPSASLLGLAAPPSSAPLWPKPALGEAAGGRRDQELWPLSPPWTQHVCSVSS